MNFKILSQGMFIGVVIIIILMLFQKITKIDIPTWLGSIIIIFFIILVSSIKK